MGGGNERADSNHSQSSRNMGAMNYMDEAGRGAGLTTFETEKLRDQKYNFAAEFNRKDHAIENEKGGIFDRVENSGVRNVFIPKSNNLSEELSSQFQMNKQKHMQHVIKLGEDAETSLMRAHDPFAPSNVENMGNEEKRQLINHKLVYMTVPPA